MSKRLSGGKEFALCLFLAACAGFFTARVRAYFGLPDDTMAGGIFEGLFVAGVILAGVLAVNFCLYFNGRLR